jgi:hypothetical protein
VHARTLEQAVDEWFSRHPYGVFGQYEPGPPEQYVFKVRFLDPIPPTWAITLGDFAHNARSALDHLAYVVVLANNGGVDEWTQFPIVLCPWEWQEQADRMVGNASDRHKSIIESFQPYHQVDFSGFHDVWSAIDDPLALLHRLNNIDKHRVLNATPAAILSIGYDIEPVSDVGSVGHAEINHGPLLDGEEMVTVPITSSGPNPELRLTRHETVEIKVQYRVDLSNDSYTLRNVNLKESLESILARLTELFEVFVYEFR